MRIGILTLPLHTNYGGILQAYALQTILERMGHKVVVFDKPPHWSLPILKLPYFFSKRLLLKYVLHKPIKIFEEQYLNETYPVISQYTRLFIDKYIHRLLIGKFQSINREDLDAIIVGSDQVWRLRYFTWGYGTYIENAYLQFARNWNILRIAYAASFGTDVWEYSSRQTRHCGKLLQRFNAVSVREKSGVRLCQEYLNVNNVQHVLDPTMLLESKDYVRLFQLADAPQSKGTLLNYILDESEEKKQLIKKIASQKNLIPFRVNSKVEDLNAPLKERIQPSVEEWLRGFYDAEFVVTDSFHACVFSILFKKPFIVYGNKERGLSRFKSLLSQFGLEDRLVINCNDNKILGEIDYDRVYQKLGEMRTKSMNFIEESM